MNSDIVDLCFDRSADIPSASILRVSVLMEKIVRSSPRIVTEERLRFVFKQQNWNETEFSFDFIPIIEKFRQQKQFSGTLFGR